ncbi:MAG: cation transporter [Bacteroidales bacterium]|nr:cation transporter [Bacteroidales bacterium]
MSHQHIHDHHSSEKNLKTALWLNALFAVIEVVGGIMTNSIAVLSDALHDAGDTIAIGIAWYFQRVSRKKRDLNYSFGYRRFSVLGALINSLVLLSGSCIILVEAIPRILAPQEVEETGMLLLAIMGIIVNGIAMFKVKKGQSRNEQVISLHLLEDVLGWVAVLLVSILLHFVHLPILDPILSVAVTLFILYRLFGSLRKTFRILLQGTPSSSQGKEISEKLMKNIPEITGIHDLHVWSMDGSYHVASLHIEVSTEMNLSDTETLKNQVREELMNLSIEHATLEIELKGQDCRLQSC